MARTTKVKIDARQLKRIAKNFNKSPRFAREQIGRAITAAQFVLTKNTLKDNPVPYRTGFLLSSFVYNRLGEFKARWTPTAFYAAWVDQGTKNMRPRFYMTKIEKKARPEINKLFKTVADRIADEITRS